MQRFISALTIAIVGLTLAMAYQALPERAPPAAAALAGDDRSIRMP